MRGASKKNFSAAAHEEIETRTASDSIGELDDGGHDQDEAHAYEEFRGDDEGDDDNAYGAAAEESRTPGSPGSPKGRKQQLGGLGGFAKVTPRVWGGVCQ